MLVDKLLRATILLLVAALPWCFGGVAPLYRSIAAAVLTGCLVALLFRSRVAAAWWAVRWQLAVLVPALLLGLVQLWPAATGVVGRFNPTATAIPHDFAALPAEAAADAAHDATTTTAVRTQRDSPRALSLHAVSTRRDLASFTIAVAAFILGAALFADTRSIILLMIVTATVGLGISLFGIVQRLTWNGLIYWSQPTYGGQPFGPFINRNNAGGFLEIGLAAAIGLLLWRMLSIPALPARNAPLRLRPEDGPSIGRRAAWIFANLNGSMLSSAAAVLVVSAGILATLSRGSVVAMCAGAGISLLLMTVASRRTTFAWTLGLIVVAGIAFTSWLGQNEAIFDRLATLLDPQLVDRETRFTHWKASVAAAADFWLAGSGLGTYRYAYSRHQVGPASSVFYYAENQYLDALVSGGVIGLALVAMSILLFAVCIFRLLRHARTSADFGIAATGAILLATQMLHACFDFALYVPANFIVFALFCGALSRRAAACRLGSLAEEESRRPKPFPRVAAAAFCLAMACALIVGADELRRAAICRDAELATRFTGDADARTLEWVDEALAKQSRAVAACTDDAEARTRLAELWVERYRLLFRQEIGNFPVSPSVYLWGKPERLYADAHLLARTWNDAGLDELRKYPLVAENLGAALAEARIARELCPLSPYPQMLVAKLCFLDEAPQNDLHYLGRVEQLVGGREAWLYEIGALHLDAARPDRAFAAWRQCLLLSLRHERQIIHFASGFLKPSQLLEKVVPPKPEVIVHIAQTHFVSAEQRRDRDVFFHRAAELLASESSPTANDFRLRGLLAVDAGNLDEGLAWYDRAIALDATNAYWLFEAASANALAMRWQTAASLARQSLRLNPNVPGCRTLLEHAEAEMSVRGDGTSDS